MMSRIAIRLVLSVCLMVAVLGDGAAIAAPARDKHWALLAGRLFPALTALAQSREGAHVASSVRAERRKRLEACQRAAPCVLRATLWTEAEMAELATQAEPVLEPAGKATTADDGVSAQVLRELKGLNAIVQVYGLRAVPRYPQIDGPIDAPGSAQFNATLADAMMLADAGHDDPGAHFDPSLAVVMALLDANGADDAVAFEPLDATHNAGALSLARTIDWKRYRYVAIIAPGVGPTDLSTPLSARGKLNVRLAAERFAAGLAPFVIVSGSGVHPKGTAFVEAIEMRKALVERYGVPAERVLIEPYARHTTTNLRNVTRRLLAMGAPLDHEALIVTNPDHTQYIEGPDFKARAAAELGYQPGRITARLSPMELVFKPSSAAARVDPSDPRDP